MPDNARSAPPLPRPAILTEAEAARRMLLLAELQAALDAQQVRSVLARNHRLVLQYNQFPCEPSGLTSPQLHIFTPDGTDVATTDGTTYALARGQQYPASDPAAAAAAVAQGHARSSSLDATSTRARAEHLHGVSLSPMPAAGPARTISN